MKDMDILESILTAIPVVLGAHLLRNLWEEEGGLVLCGGDSQAGKSDDSSELHFRLVDQGFREEEASKAEWLE